MRVLKFRAWDRGHAKMYGFLPLIIAMNHLEPTYWEPLLEKAQKQFEVMQFTGIKDRRGYEVYEGDILRYTDPDDEPAYWAVSFVDGCFVVNNSAIWDYLKYDKHNKPTNRLEFLQVVGDIYRSPELLDQQNEGAE